MRVLLHICCAPCATYTVKALRETGETVTGYFFNPNIHPYTEFKTRLDNTRIYAADQGLELILDSEYDPTVFLRAVHMNEEKGRRCEICYRMRLAGTAKKAAELGFDAFTSTLFYSKHQMHDRMRQIAQEQADKNHVEFLYRDFRPGWKEGISLSKEMKLYRQQYCGCIFSERERYLGEKSSG